MRVMYALLRDRYYALLGEEELFDRAVGDDVSAIGSIALEVWSIEGGDPALPMYKPAGIRSWHDRTYSHGCCRSTAVLEWYRMRMSRWVPQDDAALEEVVEQSLAVYQSVAMHAC